GRQGGVLQRHRAAVAAAASGPGRACRVLAMKPLRVAIAGASGRMGHALLEAAANTEGMALAGAFDVSAGSWGGVAIGNDVSRAIADADVLIDFTRPAATVEHVRACAHASRAMVIGTTGF